MKVWLTASLTYIIGFHMTPKINKVLPESSLLIVVGVIIGLILYSSTKLHVSPLTPNTFFFYMLPPIILDAGYFMPNRLFFDNIGTILLMAVIGTIFNVATIGEFTQTLSITNESNTKNQQVAVCTFVARWVYLGTFKRNFSTHFCFHRLYPLWIPLPFSLFSRRFT